MSEKQYEANSGGRGTELRAGHKEGVMSRQLFCRPANLGALAVAISLMVAACGSSGSKSSSQPTGSTGATTSGTTVPATGTPLVIGTIEDQTGVPGLTGRVTTGTAVMQAWTKWTNAHGGVNGHPVKLISFNDNSDPAQAKSDLVTLVEQDKVLAVVGEDAQSTEPSWGPFFLAQRTPVIGGAAYSANWFTNPMFYPVTTTVITNVWAQVYAAKTLQKDAKLASLLCSNLTTCQGAVPIIAASAKQLGVPIVYNETADSNAPDYTPQCLAMKGAGANVVQAAVNNVILLRDCHRQNFSPLVIATNYGPTPSQTQQNPSELVGQVGPAPAFPPFEEFPQTKAYFEALAQYAPQYLPGGSEYEGAASSVQLQAAPDAWAAGQAFAKAIENSGVPASGTVTREDLIRGLSMFKNDTLGGISPPLTYGNGTTPNLQVLCFYLYKTVNSPAGFETIPPHTLSLSCQTAAQAEQVEAALPKS